MDIARLLQVVWRFRLLVACGFALATIVALHSYVSISFSGGPKLKYREDPVYLSASAVLVTQAGFPWGRAILDDEMKVLAAGERLTDIAKTLTHYDGAYIGTTAVGADLTVHYWAAFDAVAAEADIRTASVEMVLARLARDTATAPRLQWIEGLRWYEVDTQEDLDLARGGLGA